MECNQVNKMAATIQQEIIVYTLPLKFLCFHARSLISTMLLHAVVFCISVVVCWKGAMCQNPAGKEAGYTNHQAKSLLLFNGKQDQGCWGVRCMEYLQCTAGGPTNHTPSKVLPQPGTHTYAGPPCFKGLTLIIRTGPIRMCIYSRVQPETRLVYITLSFISPRIPTYFTGWGNMRDMSLQAYILLCRTAVKAK